MIENLKGTHETVNYKEYTNIRLYDNTQAEDYPSHWHTPLEIIMPLTGKYTIVLSTHSIDLKPGDIILICPGVIHALKAPKFGRRIIFQAELPMFHEIKELETIPSRSALWISATSSKRNMQRSLFISAITSAVTVRKN